MRPTCYYCRVNSLFVGLLGALLSTNQPQSVSNLIQQKTGVALTIPDPNDPAQKELDRLMAEDDTAMAQVNKWISDNMAFAEKGGGESRAELNARIMARLNAVRKQYDEFLNRYPDFAPGRLAYASFLEDIGDDEAARVQNEKAIQLDPKNPAAWNNMANYFAENGPITNAFFDLDKAIELDPNEPVYYQNLGVMVYLYRPDAENFYHINEQQVFDKSIALYRKAMKLDPDNFSLATDYAEGYYGIRPLRVGAALEAWTNTLQIAHNEAERESVYIHLARVKMLAGRFAEARAQLNAVTNAQFETMKKTVGDAINWRENQATNPAAADDPSTIAEPSTNSLSAPTNAPVALTNGPSALTSPTPSSAKIAAVTTHVPPGPLKPAAAPPAVKP